MDRKSQLVQQVLRTTQAEVRVISGTKSSKPSIQLGEVPRRSNRFRGRCESAKFTPGKVQIRTEENDVKVEKELFVKSSISSSV